MSRIEDISLQESLPQNTGEQTPHETEEDDVALGRSDSDSRQREPKMKRACVLLGSAMLQLPIWGFAMSYGVFQEYYSSNWTLEGSRSATGIIGTTSNGVMYLSMPFLFALYTKKWAHRRLVTAICGAALMGISFFASSYSTNVSQLIITHGIMAPLGCALIYSPTTLSLGEWFNTSNRAVAYGVVLSCKNIVGSACPFLIRGLLDKYGLRTTIRIWAVMAIGTSIPAIFLIPTHPSAITQSPHRNRKIPWDFLKHQTFYIYAIAIVFQSSGYGIPQTYLNTYAHDVTMLSQTTATLLLTCFNLPGIASSTFFGYLSDNKYLPLTPTTITSISAMSSAASAFLFWGLTYQGSLSLLLLFSMTFGFFAGGYSATFGGMINEMEHEAAARNEAIDTGMVYGLLNGARGVGYVGGGLASVPLLQIGWIGGRFGIESAYGPLIVFTGLSSVVGGWGLFWKMGKLVRWV